MSWVSGYWHWPEKRVSTRTWRDLRNVPSPAIFHRCSPSSAIALSHPPSSPVLLARQQYIVLAWKYILFQFLRSSFKGVLHEINEAERCISACELRSTRRCTIMLWGCIRSSPQSSMHCCSSTPSSLRYLGSAHGTMIHHVSVRSGSDWGQLQVLEVFL